MKWTWARKPTPDNVTHLRSITLNILGKYYKPMYFDRVREFKIENELIDMILCYYCDDIATQKDHVYPISALTRDVQGAPDITWTSGGR